MNKPVLKFSESLSNKATKILPTSSRLRTGIMDTLKKSDNSIQISNLQSILNDILSSYDVNGFVVYSEVRDMLDEGILEINNAELNNESIISKKIKD